MCIRDRDKTVTVAAKFKEKHPIYGKFVSKTKKYHACLLYTSVSRLFQMHSNKQNPVEVIGAGDIGARCV